MKKKIASVFPFQPLLDEEIHRFSFRVYRGGLFRKNAHRVEISSRARDFPSGAGEYSFRIVRNK